MQFGVHLPTHWPNYGTSTISSAIEEAARSAAALSYASIWTNDTIVVSEANAWAGYVIEPLITLASLIHLVPTLHFGLATLILAQRNAILAAKQMAALDILSRGRFIAGIGVGWRADEFAYLGADFAARGAHTDESIEAMRSIWNEPVSTYHSAAYDLRGAISFPKPASPTIPLWIGGNSRAAVRRAARFGHAWIPFGIELAEFRERVTYLRTLTTGQATPLIAAEMILHIDAGHSMTAAQVQEAPASTHIAGSPDYIVEMLTGYQQAGMDYLVCAFEAQTVETLQQQMQLFAERVMPHL
jgi:probable F420-dependent oxidoreductase